MKMTDQYLDGIPWNWYQLKIILKNDHNKNIGVPEHFNLPWHLAIENRFNQQNIDLQWTDVPEGTKMCQMYVLVRPTSQ
jgi:hypothetical protein